MLRHVANQWEELSSALPGESIVLAEADPNEDPDKAVPEAANPAPDPASSSGGDNCGARRNKYLGPSLTL